MTIKKHDRVYIPALCCHGHVVGKKPVSNIMAYHVRLSDLPDITLWLRVTQITPAPERGDA